MKTQRAVDISGTLFEDLHVVKMPKRKYGYRGKVGDIEVLKDGRLLMCYTSAGEMADITDDSVGAGDILGSVSKDQGQTWDEPVVLVPRPKPFRKGEQYFHPSLLRLENGHLLLTYIYLAGSDPRYAHTYYRRSTDDGTTWGDQLIVTPRAIAYFVAQRWRSTRCTKKRRSNQRKPAQAG